MALNIHLSDKARSVIAAIAPTLGVALGGPLGGLAGQVIASSVGAKDSKDVEDALITQRPELLMQLKQAEKDFTLKMEELGIEKDRLAYADVASARDLAKVNMRPQIVIASVFIGGYFTILLALATGVITIDKDARDLINSLMLVITGSIPMIMQFFFGSSAGSQLKSHLLAQSTPPE